MTVLIDNHCTRSLLVLDGAKSLFRLTKLGCFRSAYGVAEWRLAQAQAFKMFLFISRSAEHFLAPFLHIVRTNSVRLRPYLLDNFLYSKFKILTYSRIQNRPKNCPWTLSTSSWMNFSEYRSIYFQINFKEYREHFLTLFLQTFLNYTCVIFQAL